MRRDMVGIGQFCRPFPYCRFDIEDMDAVDRTWWYAKIAASTLGFDDRVHLLGGAQYGIDRTCLDAQGAADADLLIDANDGGQGFYRAVLGIEWFNIDTEQVSQRDNGGLAARRTLVDVGFAFCQGFSVGAAAGVGALSALCLWQQCINLVDHRVTFNFELHCGVGEYQAKDYGDDGECDDDG